MRVNLATALQDCETLMLDMDGTLLDLAYDNYMWLEHIPAAFAQQNEIELEDARSHLRETLSRLEGKLDWYDLDHWGDALQLDVVDMHKRQNSRIGFLPGALEFLESLAGHDLRVLMMTNSHQKTLDIKEEVTGITRFFDGIYTSHAVGHAKEEQAYWHVVAEEEGFDIKTSLFIDDNLAVLQSAHDFGITNLLNIARPDTGRPRRSVDHFDQIDGVADLLGG